GYEAFEEHLDGVDAYVVENHFDEGVLKALQENVAALEFTYEWEVLEEKNWNKEWEENYQPTVIADKLLIRSTFHEPQPDLPYEIIINPQMSFGTGHHETTTLMLEALLECDLHGKKVLDVGCGTGILAIFAAQQGAKVLGVDIEDNAYQNALENVKLNKVENAVEIQKGTVQDVNKGNYDIILANINRNVLLNDMPEYADRLADRGILLLSGFYESDMPKMEVALKNASFLKYEKQTSNEWTLVKVLK
ncbi:MAG: 50S ribosomal protein L11 methyltransferase, partial [Bacteroidia bacterium]